MIAGKLLALTLGAAGVGLFGLLRQLLQNLTLIGSVNGQTALVQGLASRPEPTAKLRYSGTVLCIQGFTVASVAIGILLLAPWLGPWLIPHRQAVALLRWLALAMSVTVAQAHAIGLLNGHRLTTDYLQVQVLGALMVVALAMPMARLVREGLSLGLLVLMLVGPSTAVVLATVWKGRKGGWLLRLSELRIDRRDGSAFFRMSAGPLLTGLIATGTQFFMSWMVARQLGLAEAGQFWTAWTLSMAYVTLVLGSLGTYYLPSLSGIADHEERRALIRAYLDLALLFMPLLVALFVVFKPWIILGLFSPDLLPALKVMRWMLVGDLFKGISWVLAFPMLAFGEMKWYFWMEAAFSLGMAGAMWAWLASGGSIEGLGVLFLVSYVLYLCVMVYYIRIRHGFAGSRSEIARFLCGFAVVLGLTASTWLDQGVRGMPVFLMVVLDAGFLAFCLRGDCRSSIFPARSRQGH